MVRSSFGSPARTCSQAHEKAALEGRSSAAEIL
jgi:hypothetical protein